MERKNLAKILIVFLLMSNACFICVWLNAERQTVICHKAEGEIRDEKKFYENEYTQSVGRYNLCVENHNKCAQLANEVSSRTLEIVNGVIVSPEEFREYAADIIKILEKNEKFL